jgi:hypothetical protein
MAGIGRGKTIQAQTAKVRKGHSQVSACFPRKIRTEQIFRISPSLAKPRSEKEQVSPVGLTRQSLQSLRVNAFVLPSRDIYQIRAIKDEFIDRIFGNFSSFPPVMIWEIKMSPIMVEEPESPGITGITLTHGKRLNELYRRIPGKNNFPTGQHVRNSEVAPQILLLPGVSVFP